MLRVAPTTRNREILRIAALIETRAHISQVCCRVYRFSRRFTKGVTSIPPSAAIKLYPKLNLTELETPTVIITLLLLLPFVQSV